MGSAYQGPGYGRLYGLVKTIRKKLWPRSAGTRLFLWGGGLIFIFGDSDRPVNGDCIAIFVAVLDRKGKRLFEFFGKKFLSNFDRGFGFGISLDCFRQFYLKHVFGSIDQIQMGFIIGAISYDKLDFFDGLISDLG